MNLESNMIINAYSIVLLAIVYIQYLKHVEKGTLLYRIYSSILLIAMILLVLDSFSRCDGNLNTIYPVFNYLGNFLIYLLSPVLPSLWLLYAHTQIFHSEQKTKRLYLPLLVIIFLNGIMLILSQIYGWFYYIDENNIYHRGSLFWVPASITVALLLIGIVLIGVNRKTIERKYYFALIFFAVPPLLCVIMQILFYGVSLMLNSVVISVLIVFFNIENRSLYTDYLTGVNNRKKLDAYMAEKIRACTEKKTFSAILLDLNNFKAINDTFGHDMGDDALEVAAKLLNSCLRSNDFIARYGGDEFYIILDIFNDSHLDSAITRINTCIEKYNATSSMPYELGFSMGYAVYDYSTRLNVDEFQKQLDVMMYENKRANKDRTI